MAKDLKVLIANIANLGKSASIEQSVSDPADKGDANTAVPSERIIAPLPGQNVSLENLPAVSSTEPAAEAKIEPGESTGKVTAAQDFVEPASVAGAKSAANVIQGAAELRSKLANFGKTIETATPATPELTAETKSAAYVPGDFLLKVAFHLMESSAGQALVNQALDEVMGHDKAAALMKRAADEHADFLRDYTVLRLQEAEIEAEQMKQAAFEQQLAHQYYELTKGASAEQLAAIDQSAELIKGASTLFADHPLAAQWANFGIMAAEKAAAAMEQGMAPDEAAAMAAAEGAGEGAPSPEELQSALMVLVEQGAITPEQAEQLMMELLGGGAAGGAGMEGEDPTKQAAVNEALSKIASTIFS